MKKISVALRFFCSLYHLAIWRFMVRFGKCIVVILLLLSAKIVFASTLISESWESWLGQLGPPLRWCFHRKRSYRPQWVAFVSGSCYPSGMDGGNAPDIVTAYISGQSELYIQYYFKYSSNWVNHEVEQKHLFVWGGNDNFYTARGLFSNEMAFDLQGPGGSEVLQSSGINIQNNRWYKVTMHIIKNSANTSNGTAQMWLDDAIINRTGIRYWNSGASFDRNGQQHHIFFR